MGHCRGVASCGRSAGSSSERTVDLGTEGHGLSPCILTAEPGTRGRWLSHTIPSDRHHAALPNIVTERGSFCASCAEYRVRERKQSANTAASEISISSIKQFRHADLGPRCTQHTAGWFVTLGTSWQQSYVHHRWQRFVDHVDFASGRRATRCRSSARRPDAAPRQGRRNGSPTATAGRNVPLHGGSDPSGVAEAKRTGITQSR